MDIIEKFIETAEKDRYALIIEENNEAFAESHLRELFDAYPCTGILVKQTVAGKAYHVSPVGPEVILPEGFRVSEEEEDGTYGGGVVYTYPSLQCYTGLNEKLHVYAVYYGPGTLRAIATVDKSEKEQGEICIPPECIVKVEYCGTGTEALAK